MVPPAKDIADSTQEAETLRVNGTVVAEVTPAWYSPHPFWGSRIQISIVTFRRSKSPAICIGSGPPISPFT